MIGTLRQPEHTGENRCWPCTTVNALIAVGLAGIVGVEVAQAVGATVAAAVGGVVVAVSLALIYLRGYLVPGTPALTKRYLPASVLRLFGKEPAAAGETVRGDEGGPDVDAEAALRAVDALEPCADRDDLCLSDAFRRDWNEAIESVREAGVDAAGFAERLGISAAEADIGEYEDARLLKTETDVVGKWPSQAALVADSAAATLLERRYAGWDDLSPKAKGQVLNGLRLFLEDCPTGRGGVEFGEETVESCCSTVEVVAVTCEKTGERLFEQPVPE